MKRLLSFTLLVCCTLGYNARVSAQIITTIAGNGTANFNGDGGAATAASLNFPRVITVDAMGNVYIVDYYNNRIRKVNSAGIISTIAGNNTAGFSGDGGAATAASLNHPRGVAVDASGNIYIADEENHRVRKINSSGVISTIAGNGISGYSGDGGAATAASLRYPSEIALDTWGNVYIADPGNYRIRKVDSAGIISTVAGNGISVSSGDGGAATAASLKDPMGIAVDAFDNLFIVDFYNNQIRKINSAGIISTIVGNGIQGFSGDGGTATAASLYFPNGITFDAMGNLYIVDVGNHRIRKVNSAGIISTIAGNGTAGFSGDGSAAISASLNGPSGIAVDVSGNIYIADGNNNRIRKVIITPSSIEQVASNNHSLSLYPNPNEGSFTIKGSVVNKSQHTITLEVYNIIGQSIYKEEVAVTNGMLEHKVDLSGALPGNYFVKLNDGESSVVRFTVAEN